MLRGALGVKDNTDHVFGFFRNISKLSPDRTARDFLDLDSQGRQDEEARTRRDLLEGELRTRFSNNVHTYLATWTGTGPSVDHLHQLCWDVYKRLSEVIEAEIHKWDRSNSVDQEAEAHQAFGQERAPVFIGRRDALRQIQRYLDSSNRHPLVVHGVSCCGKSALVAKAVTDHKSRVTSHEIIVRYIGATPASSDIRSLLEGLCKEITLRYSGELEHGARPIR